MKKKALSSILLVGKGFSFENAPFFLQARIRSKLPSGLKKYSEQIDVTGKVRVSSVLFICNNIFHFSNVINELYEPAIAYS